MWWLIIWTIGAILAFGLLFADYCVENSKLKKGVTYKQSGIVVIGTFLSWITIFIYLYREHKELKEENKFKDYGKTKQE